MSPRDLLTHGIRRIVETNFGFVPESLNLEGTLMLPSGFRRDCTRLAKEILAEEHWIANVFSADDVSRHIESIALTTVRQGTSHTAALIDELCARFEHKDEAKIVFIPLQGVKLARSITRIGDFRLR